MSEQLPTDKEIQQSRDPAWLRDQADRMEVYSDKIVEQLRIRADLIEIENKLGGEIKELGKLDRLLGAKETAFKKMQGG